MKKAFLYALGCILLLALLAVNTFSPGYDLEWYAVGPSSAINMQGNMKVFSMIGQGIAGEVSFVNTELCSGYLCVLLPINSWVFLPLIVK